jgi:hypothetical protein
MDGVLVTHAHGRRYRARRRSSVVKKGAGDFAAAAHSTSSVDTADLNPGAFDACFATARVIARQRAAFARRFLSRVTALWCFLNAASMASGIEFFFFTSALFKTCATRASIAAGVSTPRKHSAHCSKVAPVGTPYRSNCLFAMRKEREASSAAYAICREDRGASDQSLMVTLLLCAVAATPCKDASAATDAPAADGW